MAKAKLACNFKHTPYDPPRQKWRCPKCGSKDGFAIENSVNDACLKVHDQDETLCMDCDYQASGKVAMRTLIKMDNKVPCPTCHGSGSVDGS